MTSNFLYKKDTDEIFAWAKKQRFSLKKAPTAKGYSNKPIYHCLIKRRNGNISNTITNDKVYNIMKNEHIFYAAYAMFEAGTTLEPHVDPDIYKKGDYLRIQIPLEIPDTASCFMVEHSTSDRYIYWQEGKAIAFPVMNKLHSGCNLSDKPMSFIFLDVAFSSTMPIDRNGWHSGIRGD